MAENQMTKSQALDITLTAYDGIPLNNETRDIVDHYERIMKAVGIRMQDVSKAIEKKRSGSNLTMATTKEPTPDPKRKGAYSAPIERYQQGLNPEKKRNAEIAEANTEEAIEDIQDAILKAKNQDLQQPLVPEYAKRDETPHQELIDIFSNGIEKAQQQFETHKEFIEHCTSLGLKFKNAKDWQSSWTQFDKQMG